MDVESAQLQLCGIATLVSTQTRTTLTFRTFYDNCAPLTLRTLLACNVAQNDTPPDDSQLMPFLEIGSVFALNFHPPPNSILDFRRENSYSDYPQREHKYATTTTATTLNRKANMLIYIRQI